MANEIAEYAVKILRQYAEETQGIVRSTSDISPLEEWLIIKLFQQLQWIRFEDRKPEPGQEIFIVWPSGTLSPEFRQLSKQELMDSDWSLMRWFPVPPYPSIQV